MQITGEWYIGDDGTARPVLRGEILTENGSWLKAPFLVDTGADRTVLSAALLSGLHLPTFVPQDRLGGVGGLAESVIVKTQICFSRETGSKVVFRGLYAAIPQLEMLDISVLGRDVTGLFAVIVDQPRNVVYLLGQRHGYSITQS